MTDGTILREFVTKNRQLSMLSTRICDDDLGRRWCSQRLPTSPNLQCQLERNMRSKVSIGGHPLHTVLVALPIGLFIWAFASDIIYLATDRDHTWYEIAFWSGSAGVGTALVAALAGFGDYLGVAVHTDAKRIGLIHMVLNLTVTAMFAVAAFLMLDDGAVSGSTLAAVVALHAVGIGFLGISGWLGGEMVVKHHIGIVPDDVVQERDERARHEGVGPLARR